MLINYSLDSDYFVEYAEEYEFIKNHYDTYKTVPDVETFISNFPDFEMVEVNESERYLVDTIREEYLYSKEVPVIKQAAELLKADANEACRYLQSELVNLQPTYSTPFVDITKSRERFETFKEKSANKDKWFISTGFEELDDIVGGWQMGEELVVLFARTGNGKSWVLVKSMEHAWSIGKNVGYISPEMSADKIGYRFDTIHHHFSNTSLVRGDNYDIKEADYSQYFDTLAERDNKFLVSTPRDFSNKITVSKLRNFIVANKLDVLAIDGITYMSDERAKRGDNKTTLLTNISEDLMQLSCDLKIPIVVVVQSNRCGADKDTPDLEDIRDSDGIAHNATKVISLNKKEEALIMKIKKHRDGKVGDKLTYMWDADCGEFQWVPSGDDEAPPEKKEERREEIKQTFKKEGKVVF
jgi:replicative DNA helicase